MVSGIDGISVKCSSSFFITRDVNPRLIAGTLILLNIHLGRSVNDVHCFSVYFSFVFPKERTLAPRWACGLPNSRSTASALSDLPTTGRAWKQVSQLAAFWNVIQITNINSVVTVGESVRSFHTHRTQQSI